MRCRGQWHAFTVSGRIHRGAEERGLCEPFSPHRAAQPIYWRFVSDLTLGFFFVRLDRAQLEKPGPVMEAFVVE